MSEGANETAWPGYCRRQTLSRVSPAYAIPEDKTVVCYPKRRLNDRIL
jgi:hypothetical protein